MKAKHIFNLLYSLLFLFVCGLVYYGRSYYFLPITSKVRHPLHPVLRQSGSLGHGLGFVGSAFMILLLLYSFRKRLRIMKNWGTLNLWLGTHIFLGFAGPILIFFHANFQFSGIVALSFWSMILVVLSGIIGRYIFHLIPRSLSGMEYNRFELEAEEIGLTFEVRKLLPRDHPFWRLLQELDSEKTKVSAANAFFLFFSALRIRWLLRKAVGKIEALDPPLRKKLKKLLIKRQVLIKRMDFLDSTLKILHYWHLIHQPFVILMFLIMILHVFITIKMGYRWIF